MEQLARDPFDLATTVYCLSICRLSMLYDLSRYYIDLFLYPTLCYSSIALVSYLPLLSFAAAPTS